MAGFDFLGGIGLDASSLINVPIIVIGVILGVLLVTLGFLWIRKRRKLIYPCAEVVDLGGQGKTSLNFLGRKSCGWFGKNRVKWLFNMWDYGDEVMRLKTGEIIEEFSEEDFQEVNGIRGVVFYRDPVRRLLFPINKLDVTNKNLVLSIAPASFTDTGLDIMRSAEKETESNWDRILPIIIFGVIIIFALVAIIVTTNLISHVSDNAAKAQTEGLKVCMENSKMVCEEVWRLTSGASTAP